MVGPSRDGAEDADIDDPLPFEQREEVVSASREDGRGPTAGCDPDPLQDLVGRRASTCFVGREIGLRDSGRSGEVTLTHASALPQGSDGLHALMISLVDISYAGEEDQVGPEGLSPNTLIHRIEFHVVD